MSSEVQYVVFGVSHTGKNFPSEHVRGLPHVIDWNKVITSYRATYLDAIRIVLDIAYPLNR